MLDNIITYLSIFSPLIPIVVGYKKKSLLWIYALAGLLFDIALRIKGYVDVHKLVHLPVSVNVLLFVNIFLLAEFLFIAFYYRHKIFKTDTGFYAIASAIALGYAAITIYNSISSFSNYGEAFLSIVYMLFSIVGLYSILQKQEFLFLNKSSFFWVNVAVLIYSTGNFLIFLSDKFLQSANEKIEHEIWIFHNFLNVSFSILVAIALYREKQTT